MQLVNSLCFVEYQLKQSIVINIQIAFSNYMNKKHQPTIHCCIINWWHYYYYRNTWFKWQV